MRTITDLAEARLETLLAEAEAVSSAARGGIVTYSRKVFIPLTRLCRDVCHYCTFATAPRHIPTPYLTIGQAVDIARAGAAAGCKEALFTLGDQPERRYPTARTALDAMGFATTLDYLAAAAAAVRAETGLLPHLNPGVMSESDIAKLRPHAVSMGIMLETSSDRLSARGGPHYGSPDKLPAARMETLAALGRQAVPTTTGLLIGIGETRAEMVEALSAIRDLHLAHGHIQEVIIQNFRAKPGTRMAKAPEPSLEDHLWAIAAARLILPTDIRIQAPPNLRPGVLAQLLRAGVDDWGGVSPVTPDHVNPEAPWPELARLERETAAAGRRLVERLAIGPDHVRDPMRWLDVSLRTPVLRAIDAHGHARTIDWHAGTGQAPPAPALLTPFDKPIPSVARALAMTEAGEALNEGQIAALFTGGEPEYEAIARAADRKRAAIAGDTITYVVNRNINYTNICSYRCAFCAFSKGSTKSERGPAYRLDLAEIGRRTAEAWELGATEVCLQGGIHPDYDGETYLSIVAAVKEAAPRIHVHAFSPLEVSHGAATLGLPLRDYLARLKAAGLSSLPGTAAEILDDAVRAVICPDKLGTQGWIEVMRVAHDVGLRSTSTIMYGHVDRPEHWARHLLRIAALQRETGGFTEFVPLPFVHMEAPMWRKGLSRSGPTWREAILMHSIARLVLSPAIPNIQASWVKLGPAGAARALQAGCNDIGGTLIDESITRAAGGVNGQHFDAVAIERLAAEIGRPARVRTTFYGEPRDVAAA
ncbi:MAG TPA: 5-amino-6-(D-ribitylamino)uracil--L-tyrosine 4-hydroxyphenyl transferase CofH [Sphingomonas sp.]|nr:5-amino-6-(D-ribitylamino)uracil--L-tyrosine 4-hydroxyphenyl transferase CofH [Sphingomonas sp.]